MFVSPLVSIITPSYNQAGYLEQTICSVLEQDYQNIEYIVMDGGSTDGSVDIIRKYANRLAYWESGIDSGQANAINKGLRIAKGDILGWINSDDLLEPDAITRVFKCFYEKPESALVYGAIIKINEQGNPLNTHVPNIIHNLKDLLINPQVVQPGSFWQRRIMEKIGLLNETLHYVMDYEYWLRIVIAGGILESIPLPPLARFRVTSRSKSSNDIDIFGLEKLDVLDSIVKFPHFKLMEQKHHNKILFWLRRGRSKAALDIAKGSLLKHHYHQTLQWFVRSCLLWPGIFFSGLRILIGTLLRIFL